MPIYKTKEVINVYCRTCGYQMSETATICNKCKTKAGEGTKFCRMCGYHTTINTEFCSNCGAKQIVTQQTKLTKIKQLQKQAMTEKKFMKLEKVFAVVGFILAIALNIIVSNSTNPHSNTSSIPLW